ncbi:MAG: cytochrome c oxidase assembly protein [Ensifer adhaerens]
MRWASLIAAMILLVAAVCTSLFVFDPRAFSGHMGTHMALVAVVAPLAAFAVSGTRWDPSSHWHPGAGLLLSFVELVVVWVWHVPAMRDLAEASIGMRLAELAIFLVAGGLLWIACLGAGRKADAGLSGAVALLLTSMHMTLLAVLLTMAPRPLYGVADVTCFGVTMTASQDQQLGGIVMLFVGAVAYLAGGVGLAARLLRASFAKPTEGQAP